MKVSVIPCGPIQANCYILTDESTHNCIVIDPGDAPTVMDYLEKNGFTAKLILLTHGHFDHCMGVSELVSKTNCKVSIHELDEELVNGSSHYISAMQYGLPPFQPSSFLADNGSIVMDSIKLKVIHTPGHSKGSVCFIDVKDGIIFSGDTLFCESIGRTDLHGGSMNDLANSVLNTLFMLPESYVVFPGHGEKTTIAHEKINNPLIRYAEYFKKQLS